jgi:hypothetical protein
LASITKDEDVMKVEVLDDVEGDEEEFKEGWDSIQT